MDNKKLPALAYNWLSIIGGFVALIAAVNILVGTSAWFINFGAPAPGISSAALLADNDLQYKPVAKTAFAIVFISGFATTTWCGSGIYSIRR